MKLPILPGFQKHLLWIFYFWILIWGSDERNNTETCYSIKNIFNSLKKDFLDNSLFGCTENFLVSSHKSIILES